MFCFSNIIRPMCHFALQWNFALKRCRVQWVITMYGVTNILFRLCVLRMFSFAHMDFARTIFSIPKNKITVTELMMLANVKENEHRRN